ncbi:MAG: DMT family transporter [Rubrivivax sp.]|nr:DMT family transporter [Rubrivivax sp.]MBK8528465.1 DMT family transporter [Rubrivivax sp.]
MVAFAANSLLCRLALHTPSAIDPTSFASLRIASGAIVLALILRLKSGPAARTRPDWFAAVALFAYAALFSFAYQLLSAATGALVLFGAVQLTMLGAGLRAGERFVPLGWFGFALAVGGLVYLVSPGLTAPPAAGTVLMIGAGIAWGVYSLRGRGTNDPLAATAGNFLRATPLALLASVLLIGQFHADMRGVALALASGAITSGMGYVIWYAALRGLSALRAATVQLSVPPIAALGGVVLLSESITLRLVVASIATLGGIALVLASRGAKPQRGV